MLRARPPDTRGQGPLIGSAGFGVVAACIVKDEAPYLEEWLCYHLALGIDHVFLYDNGSSDGSADLLERYVDHGLVTVVAWPLRGGQLAAYNHALRFFGPLATWMAFFDVDEFIVPLVDDDIPTLLARWPEAADVRLPRVEFGYSGHRRPPPGLTIEAYTQVADVLDRDPDLPARVKTVLRPSSIAAVDVHLAIVADTPVLATTDGSSVPVPTATVEREVRGLAQVNHYYTRSFEEFEAKRVRGSATGRIDRPAVPFGLPTLAIDTSAGRFAARTRATIERMRSLEPRPYHYGSGLALSQFPRANDLGLFAEFAFANVAAGLAEPVREPSIRLPNRYAGIGFLGDLTEAGHAPARADLSSSVHLAPLLGHVRGRLEASLAPGATPGRCRVTRGTLGEEPAGWRLEPHDGRAEVVFELERSATRRCQAVGFVLHTGEAVDLRLWLEVDGPAGSPAGDPPAADVRLEYAATWGGLVEIDSQPRFASRVRVTLRSGPGAIGVADLFVVSYG
jgi:hypothetical protein